MLLYMLWCQDWPQGRPTLPGLHVDGKALAQRSESSCPRTHELLVLEMKLKIGEFLDI